MHVLIAEDDVTLQQMVAIMLSRKDIPCTVVEDGRRAVDAWEGGGVDLIFMDVQMPGMNGLEATRIIRDKEKNTDGHVAIVAMTAHAMPEDIQSCREAGMDDYITKPFDFDRFFSLVDRYGGSN
jgi:CheY-like chemotaxis protein